MMKTRLLLLVRLLIFGITIIALATAIVIIPKDSWLVEEQSSKVLPPQDGWSLSQAISSDIYINEAQASKGISAPLAPVDITISDNNINENQPIGTTVGLFSTEDPIYTNTFTYTLVAGTGDTDNGSFSIFGDALQTAEVFDYEVQPSYSIRVRSENSIGETFEKPFTINVLNTPETVQFTAASQSALEDIGTMTITAILDTTAGADVTVPYTLSGTATGGGIDYSINPISPITITQGSTSANITLSIVDDNVDEANETVILTMGTPINANPGSPTVHTATITDNDTAGVILSQSGGTTNVTEGGQTDSYQIHLSSEPTSVVTITFGVDIAQLLPINPITFNNTDWSINKPITVTAVDDAIIEGSHTSTITHAASSSDTNYNGISIPNITVNITDNDSAGIIAHPTSGAAGLLTSENGLTDTFTVTLESQPSAAVTVSMQSSNTQEGIITDPLSDLLFNNTNWSTPITVTVTGVDDPIPTIDGSTPYTITLSASSSDLNFQGVTASVPATNADNDVAGLAVSPTSGVVTNEGGKSAKINVLLNTPPSFPVTVHLSSSRPSEGSVSPDLLTFNPSTWNIPQAVTVTGQDDTVADGNILYYLIFSSTSSNDPKYNGKNTPPVPIINMDAPTIEWVLPVGNEEIYYFISDSEPITLKVQPVGDEPIESVDFYRWDHVLLTRVDIKTDTNPPYQTTLDPKSLYFKFNQVFAVAYSPDNVASINVRILPFRKYVLFMPMVYRNYKPPN